MSRDHPIVWDDQKVSRLWNFYARTPPYAGNYFSNAHGRQILKASGLPLHQHIKVLDFGCGPGLIWDHLRSLNAQWSYTGVDSSRDSIAKLAGRASGHAKFAGSLTVTSASTPFPDGSFDVVLLVEVLEHLNDEQLGATLKEVGRLLNVGGAVVVTTPNEEDLSLSAKYCPECGAVFHEWQHVRSWSRASLRSCMSSHGFRERFARSLDFSDFESALVWMYRRLRRLIAGKRKPPHMIAVFERAVL
jgi:2-polyprenyl-3-methyl-5-hydroxy-6-metoxy-1,4-benzoquinol methylase